MERRAFGRMLGGWLAGVAVLPVLLGRRAAGKPTRKREPASDDYPPVIEWPLYDIRDPRFESSDISGGLPLGAVVRFTIVRYDYSTPASLKWARKAWCGYWVLTSKYTPAKPPLISNLTSFIRHTPVGRRPTHADVARILAKEART